MSVKNKALISTAIILVIVFIVGFYYYFSKVRPYNQAFNKATQSMNNEDYDKAITLYGEALNYKNDSNIDKMIDLAKRLKKSKETYGIALKQMVSKDYLTAIDSFIKVDMQDTKRCSASQDSISECKKLYIADNLKNANENITNKKFDEANKNIGNILKIDATNADAKNLKASIITAVQEEKNATNSVSNEQTGDSGSLSFSDVKIGNIDGKAKVTGNVINNSPSMQSCGIVVKFYDKGNNLLGISSCGLRQLFTHTVTEFDVPVLQCFISAGSDKGHYTKEIIYTEMPNITEKQAIALVKLKVKLNANESLNSMNSKFNYDGAECYEISKDFIDSTGQGETELQYLVNVDSGAVTECNQGVYTPLPF